MRSRVDPHRVPGWLSLPLLPLSWLYGLGASLRGRRQAREPRRLHHPVLSVGNLTVGGTGKTPVTAFLAAALRDAGLRPAILTRGYGGKKAGTDTGTLLVSDGRQVFPGAAEAGDEPYLLARRLPGVAVVRGADRYAAGLWYDKRYDVDVFLLDDGFQHRRLHRDFDLLLVDGRRGVGNGRVLPAGPLREPLSAAARADAVLVTRHGEGDPVEALPRRLRRRLGGKPVWAADLVSDGLRDAEGLPMNPPLSLRGLPAVAVAGLADPGQFFRMLAREGACLGEELSFPDHCPYGRAETDRIRAAVRRTGAPCVLATAKDAVKLEGLDLGAPLRVVELRLDPAPVELLDTLSAHPAFRALFGRNQPRGPRFGD
ncbi:MAG: tetraacyldisaccharide 4'-kinase [Acidobacteria bacterium]|nr:tetraacyldisaccharide 4'-kinase [Acidobacteriota bacterium]